MPSSPYKRKGAFYLEIFNWFRIRFNILKSFETSPVNTSAIPVGQGVCTNMSVVSAGMSGAEI